MSDRPTFETQLRLAFSAYAADAPVDVDPVAMTTFASRAPVPSTSWNLRRGSLMPVPHRPARRRDGRGPICSSPAGSNT